jgi:prophage DNA circulation protein
MARTWRQRLRRASWRGVPFYVDEASGAVGRRIEHHEYPQRDTPWAEDLGRAQRTWQLVGYVLGDDYMTTRDRMIAACQQKGAGKLIHPYLGELQVVCNGLRYRERDQEGRICRFELSFAEPGSPDAPFGVRAAGAALAVAGAALASAAHFSFGGFSFAVAGWPDFVAANAQAMLRELAQILDALRGPTLQVPDTLALAAQERALALLALDPSRVTPDAVADAVLGAIAAFAAGVTPQTALDGIALLSAVTFAAAPAPATVTPSRAQDAENAKCLSALTQQAAAAALPTPLATYPLQVYEDLVAVRTRVVAVCENVRVLATDPVYLALDELQAQAIAELAVVGATLVPLQRYQTMRSRTSLTLAQILYQDPSRADELVARTGAVDPAFLPLTGLVASA